MEREIGKRTRELSMVSAGGLGGREMQCRAMYWLQPLHPGRKAPYWMPTAGVIHLPLHLYSSKPPEEFLESSS